MGPAPAIAYQTAVFIPIGILSGWIASLLTAPAPAEQVERFFVKMHTPIGQEERLSLPLPEAVPPRQRWLDAGGLFIVRPDRQSWLGFLVAVMVVWVIIQGTQWLLRW